MPRTAEGAATSRSALRARAALLCLALGASLAAVPAPAALAAKPKPKPRPTPGKLWKSYPLNPAPGRPLERGAPPPPQGRVGGVAGVRTSNPREATRPAPTASEPESDGRGSVLRWTLIGALSLLAVVAAVVVARRAGRALRGRRPSVKVPRVRLPAMPKPSIRVRLPAVRKPWIRVRLPSIPSPMPAVRRTSATGGRMLSNVANGVAHARSQLAAAGTRGRAGISGLLESRRATQTARAPTFTAASVATAPSVQISAPEPVREVDPEPPVAVVEAEPPVMEIDPGPPVSAVEPEPREEPDRSSPAAPREEAQPALASIEIEADEKLSAIETEAERTLASIRAEVEETLAAIRADAEQTLAAIKAQAEEAGASTLQQERSQQAEEALAAMKANIQQALASIAPRAETAGAPVAAPPPVVVGEEPVAAGETPATPTRWETCEIDWWHGAKRADFFAKGRRPTGQEYVVRRSASFRWQSDEPPAQQPSIVAAHEALIDRLVQEGWERHEDGPDWYATRLRRAADTPA